MSAVDTHATDAMENLPTGASSFDNQPIARGRQERASREIGNVASQITRPPSKLQIPTNAPTKQRALGQILEDETTSSMAEVVISAAEHPVAKGRRERASREVGSKMTRPTPQHW